MTKILIFPYNGNGREALSCLPPSYELIGFIDDQKDKQGTSPEGFPIYDRSFLRHITEAKILAVPGSPVSYLRRREAIVGLGVERSRFATIIHPNTSISSHAKIGYNVLIMAGVVITSNVNIGDHVCILPNSVVHHDVKIGDYSLIGANVVIAGFVTIEKNCYVGSGSNILNNIEIGEYSLIGLGSNVLRSLPPRSKAYGNPARRRGDTL